MRVFLVVLCLFAAGCQSDPNKHNTCPRECPYHQAVSVAPATLPVAIRQANWTGDRRQGSCAWAALCDVLRSQGFDAAARRCMVNQGNGAPVPTLATWCREQKLPIAWTVNGDVELLEWCSATRRPAVIHWRIHKYGDHAVTFLGFETRVQGSGFRVQDATSHEARATSHDMAIIADNNDTGRTKRIPRDEFLAVWRKSGGAALTAIGTPLPPLK